MTIGHRPLLWIALFLSLGILVNEWVSFSFGILAFLAFLMILLSLLTQRRKIVATVFVLLSIVLAGAVFSKGYQALSKDHIYHIARYYGKDPVKVEGIIVTDVEKRHFFKGKKTTFTLKVKRFKTRWGWKKKSGKILVNIFRDEDLAYGDDVLIEGKLHKPFEFSSDGTFSYREYLNRKSIKLILSVKKQGYVKIIRSRRGNFFKAVSLKVRHRLSAVLEEHLSKNEAAIMQAVLLGERYNFPKHIRELCELCGVSHIFAISGLHLSTVAFLIFLFLKMLPIPRKGQYLSTIFLLTFYAFLTGGRPSVIRAAIMINVFLVSFIIERETDSINTLGLAALLILLMNPLNLFDVGFQLSFVSVFSIISFYPKFMNGFKRLFPDNKSKIIRYLMQSFAVSLSAYLGVAGLIVYYFHIITPVGIVANVVVIPLISVIVMLGLGLLVSGIICPACAFAFAVCIKVLLNLMVAVIFLFVQIPGAYFHTG